MGCTCICGSSATDPARLGFNFLGAVAYWPKACQPMVPFWTEWDSSARTISPAGLLSAMCPRIESRSLSAKRPAVAARPRAWSTLSLPRTVELDRAGHLGADAGGAGGSGLLEPAPGPGTDAHERDLRLRAGLQPRLVDAAAVRVVGVVRVDDLRNTRSGKLVAPNLEQVTGVGAGGDGEFLTDHPAPHSHSGIPRRGRVAHRVEADGAVRADQPFFAQCERERLDGQDMQRGAFDVQTARGYLPGRPVTARVHRITPGQAGIRELGEGIVGGQQVCAGGHRSAFTIRTVASAPPFDSGS